MRAASCVLDATTGVRACDVPRQLRAMSPSAVAVAVACAHDAVVALARAITINCITSRSQNRSLRSSNNNHTLLAIWWLAIIVFGCIAASSNSSRVRAAPVATSAVVPSTVAGAVTFLDEDGGGAVSRTGQLELELAVATPSTRVTVTGKMPTPVPTTSDAAVTAEPDPRPEALHAAARHAAAVILPHRDATGAAALAAATAAIATAAASTADGNRVDNVTRLHGGDVFNAYDADSCVTDTCVGLSSGTAGLFPKNDLNDARKYRPDAVDCRCQCLPHLSTFREDLNICVDDVHECTLAPFVSGSTAEKIPFVFLPLRGQIIHPSKEISFQGVQSPICAVSGAQYLTTTGWMDLRNPIDTDVPFRLFRDEGRTFLQWLGEADLRHKMQGRLVLVHLMCRDMASKSVAHVPPEDFGYATAAGQSAALAAQAQQNIFSPCVAFRVVGQPVKMTNNVTEVSFQPETQTTAITTTIGLSTKEYVAITICSLLLGLVYVASVLLYLYVKKRKSNSASTGGGGGHSAATASGDAAGQQSSGTHASPHNEQVTFGTGFSRSSSLHSGSGVGAFGGKIRDGTGGATGFLIGGGDARRESLRMQQHAASAVAAAAVVAASGGNGAGGASSGLYGGRHLGTAAALEELGVVKSNPLLKHYPNFDGPPDFPGSDLSASNSDAGDEDLLQHHHHHPFQPHVQRHHHAFGLQMQQQQQQQQHHHRDVIDGKQSSNTLSYSEGADDGYDNEASANSGGETECLPEENVSIVEDLSTDDKLENMKAIVNGTLRRKLYFNPAYFEPHLLMSPPAAAIEFLNKIREVISIAKYKMATKRYQPSLIVIPEEGGAGGNSTGHSHMRLYETATPTESEAYQLHGVPRTASSSNSGGGPQTPSQLSRCRSSGGSAAGSSLGTNTASCVGCPGCAAATQTAPLPNGNDDSGGANGPRNDCRNCGDKRNSIRKWLEDVSTHENAVQRNDNALDSVEHHVTDVDADEHNILDKLLDMPLLDALADTDEPRESNVQRPAAQRRERAAAAEKRTTHGGGGTDSGGSGASDTDTVKANSLDSKRSQKRMAPTPPGQQAAVQQLSPATPKIISHYLKQELIKPANNEQQQLEINNNNHNIMQYNSNNSKNSAQPFGENAATSNKSNSKIYDKMELFTQLAQTAVVGELFNNPQFKHHPSDQRNSISNTSGASIISTSAGNGTTTASVIQPSSSVTRNEYDVMQSLKQHMPDMIYEAMAKDYSKRKTVVANQSPATTSFQQQNQHHHHHHHHLQTHPQPHLPQPDYDDSSLSKKYDDIPAYVQVPTPDYNTFGRSKQNPQPDSPIYKRKSPHHLIVDYETDSLERNSTAHRRHSTSHSRSTTPATTMQRPPPTGAQPAGGGRLNGAANGKTAANGSSTSDGTSTTSSQPSPSLSTALPLEEEVEIRHTVYDRAEGYRKDGGMMSVVGTDAHSSAAAAAAARMNFNHLLHQHQQQFGGGPPPLPAKQPRIQYNTPSQGSMTIEVEHSPSEYEQSTDSEQFEPDTLDRKAARRASVSSASSAAILNLWSQHLTKTNAGGMNGGDASLRHSSLENISLPADVMLNAPTRNKQPHNQQQHNQNQSGLVLRSNGSFRSNSLSNFAALNVPAAAGQRGIEPRLQKNFNSLREIYEAKNLLQPTTVAPSAPPTSNQQKSPTAANVAAAALEREREIGRLLTLEARHSRRQRQTSGTLKKPIPPDVVPNNSNNPNSSNNSKSNARKATASVSESAAGSLLYDMPKTPTTRVVQQTRATTPATSSSNKTRSRPNSGPPTGSNNSHYELYQKNLTDWNTRGHPTPMGTSSNTTTTTHSSNTTTSDNDDDDDLNDTQSHTSASTEVTGVSDTQFNTDSGPRGQRRREQPPPTPQRLQSASSSVVGSLQSNAARKYSKVNKQKAPMPQQKQHQSTTAAAPIEILKNFMTGNNGTAADMSDFSDTSTIKSGSTNFLYQSSSAAAAAAAAAASHDELDRIEIVSTKSMSVHSVPLSRDQGTGSGGSTASASVSGLHNDYELMQQQQHHHNHHNQQQQHPAEANNNDINHEQLMYDLTSPANRFHYAQMPIQHNSTQSSAASSSSPSASSGLNAMPPTKVFRCEVNPSSHGMQIALGLKDRVKKTKDLKYAWKRFVNIATAKFAPSPTYGTTSPASSSPSGSKQSTMSKSFDVLLGLDDRLSPLSDPDEGIASINSAPLSVTPTTAAAPSASGMAAQQQQRHSADGQVSRTPSNKSERSFSALGFRSASAASTTTAAPTNGGRNDPDSGYMSADSSESKMHNRRLYERFNFRGSRAATPPTKTTAALEPSSDAADAAADVAPPPVGPKRMQDIKELADTAEVDHVPQHQKPSVTGFIPKKHQRQTTTTVPKNEQKTGGGQQQLMKPIEVNVFSSDDEKFSSDDVSTEENDDGGDEDDDDDDEDEDGVFGTGMDDDLCGSGAESVETNSVFFKNVRKSTTTPSNK